MMRPLRFLVAMMEINASGLLVAHRSLTNA